MLLLQYCTTSTVTTSTTTYYQVGTYLPSVVAEKREHCSFEKVKHNSNPRNHESSQSYLSHQGGDLTTRYTAEYKTTAARRESNISRHQHPASAISYQLQYDQETTDNKQETRIDRQATGHRSQEHSFQRFRQAGYNKFKNYIDLLSYS